MSYFLDAKVIGSLLAILGTIGILGLTVLFPWLAWVFSKFRRLTPNLPPPPTTMDSLDILIPAHNEAATLGATLASIEQAIVYLNSQENSGVRVSIYLGADCCDDNTVAVARQFKGVNIQEFSDHASKWLTLRALMTASTAPWVIWVDAGTKWRPDWLASLRDASVRVPQGVAFAPGYLPNRAGVLARFLWRLERWIKKCETSSGGPVSVHGATVAYRAPFLRAALKALGEARWINDDVAVPLMLRFLYPEGLVVYPVGEVQDAGAMQHQIDVGRRRRLVAGNLQWIGQLLWPNFWRNPIAGIVALRRVFRVVWAYWLACWALAACLAFPPVTGPFLLATVIGGALLGSFRQLCGAAWVSLLAPFSVCKKSLDAREWK